MCIDRFILLHIKDKGKNSKMFKFKKSFVGFLSLVVFFSLSHASTASAVDQFSYLNTEEVKIGVGSPIVTFKSAKNNENLNAYTLQSVKEEESIIQTISINPSAFSTTIEIPIDFQNEENLILYQDKLSKTYNAGNIHNKNHESIGIFSVQAVNNQRKEKANIISKIKDGNTLIVNVDKKYLLEPLTIIVEITASTFSTYFTEMKWIERGTIKSLSLTQKPYLTKASDVGVERVKKIDAWDKVLSIHSSNTKWSNTNGMKNQFDCHYDFAKNKNAWNLEPHRPNVDYLKTVIAGCNPK